MNDHEFIDFMQDLMLASDTVIKKEYMGRALSMIADRDQRIKELEDVLAGFIAKECEGTVGE
jgi:hypothetical protein